MDSEFSLLRCFLQASPVVKGVFLWLVGTTITSWILIGSQAWRLHRLDKARLNFERQFWSGIELKRLYDRFDGVNLPPENIARVFQAGFTEFNRLRKSGFQSLPILLEAVGRVMRIVSMQAEDRLSRSLNRLVIIESSSLYIGSLGIVWSLMQGISAVKPWIATADQVTRFLLWAPSISEVLLILAMSFCAVIPAKMFYRYYIYRIQSLINQYTILQEEFIALLLRQTYSTTPQ